MKEFVEKLIERLEERIDGNKKYTSSPMGNDARNQIIGLKKAIQIVKDLASEYNNGWIPCSERLPEVNGKYLVFVSNPTRNDKDCIFTFWYNEYYKEFKEEHDLDYVIAWQPLPAPYKKGE